MARLEARLGKVAVMTGIVELGAVKRAAAPVTFEITLRGLARALTKMEGVISQACAVSEELSGNDESHVFNFLTVDFRNPERAIELADRLDLWVSLTRWAQAAVKAATMNLRPLDGHATLSKQDASRFHNAALLRWLHRNGVTKERVACAADLELVVNYRPKDARHDRRRRLEAALKRPRSSRTLDDWRRERAPMAEQERSDELAFAWWTRTLQRDPVKALSMLSPEQRKAIVAEFARDVSTYATRRKPTGRGP